MTNRAETLVSNPRVSIPNSGGIVRPNLVDRSFQVAYKVAYRMMRVYWAASHPATHGALVMLWNNGEVLLVQNSYVPYRSLPGGYVREHESGRQAAVRELCEEVGVHAKPEDLAQPVFDQVREWEGKSDHVEIFALELTERPEVSVDHREVLDASWFSPEQALKLKLFPPIREVLLAKCARTVEVASS